MDAEKRLVHLTQKDIESIPQNEGGKREIVYDTKNR